MAQRWLVLWVIFLVAWLVYAVQLARSAKGPLEQVRMADRLPLFVTTTGTITKAVAGKESGTRRTSGRHAAFIHCQFTDGQHVYSSSRIGIGVTSFPANSLEDARRFAERYPIGSPIEVFYDPQNPRRSVLFRDAAMFSPSSAYIFYAVGVAWPILIPAFAGLALSKRGRPAKSG